MTFALVAYQTNEATLLGSNYMKRILTWAALAAPSIVSANTAAPAGVTIEDARIIGTGCDVSDTASILSGDRQAITLVFNNLFAELDGRRTTRKYCRSILNVRKPKGWTFDLVNTAYRGFITLDTGVTASHSTFYDVGRKRNEFIRADFQGDVFEDFERFDSINPAPNLSLCNVTSERLIIHNVLSMTARTRGGTGFMTIDSQDSEVAGQFTYGLRWTKCP